MVLVPDDIFHMGPTIFDDGAFSSSFKSINGLIPLLFAVFDGPFDDIRPIINATTNKLAINLISFFLFKV
ncbi:hypothetical protein D3C76_1128420 [compost metagenome]